MAFAAILLTYCVLATLQSFATRLQWGPDEPGHIIYVRSLALDLRFPTLTHGEEDDAYVPGGARTHEAHQPPLYYALAAVLWRLASHRPDQAVAFRDQAGESQSFIVPGSVRPVRLLSVVLGAAALALVWAAARTVFAGRPHLWLGGVALTAFTPMFTYVTGVINNDPLLIAAFAAVAWQWARIIRFGVTWRGVALLGLLLGLALNVKETAVALLPLSLVAVSLGPKAGSWWSRLTRMGAVLGLAGGLSAWWFVWKWAAYGSPLVYPYLYPLAGLPESQRAALLSALPRWIFLFTFLPADVISGRADTELLSRFFLALVVFSAGGLGLWALRRGRSAEPRHEAISLGLWLGLAAVVLLGLLRNVMTVDWRMGTSGGRYLSCVLPLLALTSARGLSALLGEGRGAKLGLAAVCLMLLAANLYVIWATAAEYGALGFH